MLKTESEECSIKSLKKSSSYEHFDSMLEDSKKMSHPIRTNYEHHESQNLKTKNTEELLTEQRDDLKVQKN